MQYFCEIRISANSRIDTEWREDYDIIEQCVEQSMTDILVDGFNVLLDLKLGENVVRFKLRHRENLQSSAIKFYCLVCPSVGGNATNSRTDTVKKPRF